MEWGSGHREGHLQGQGCSGSALGPLQGPWRKRAGVRLCLGFAGCVIHL